VSFVGPIIGAPYAVMLFETLIAWGARSFIFFGWCGAISPDVKIGDILIPTSAVVDEGTSIHYLQPRESVVHPSPATTGLIKTILSDRDIAFHEGRIWSTDAIFRETPDKVSHYQSSGVVAVEMELSALFSVGRFRNVDVGGILVVSDELSTLKWHPGFKDERFKQGRKSACEVIRQICQQT
jgi:uridine phosphorylase